jgi:hypothetical protein
MKLASATTAPSGSTAADRRQERIDTEQEQWAEAPLALFDYQKRGAGSGVTFAAAWAGAALNNGEDSLVLRKSSGLQVRDVEHVGLPVFVDAGKSLDIAIAKARGLARNGTTQAQAVLASHAVRGAYVITPLTAHLQQGGWTEDYSHAVDGVLNLPTSPWIGVDVQRAHEDVVAVVGVDRVIRFDGSASTPIK